RNGQVDKGYSWDINFDGKEDTVFLTSNDWGSMNLQQVGARLNVNGLSLDVRWYDVFRLIKSPVNGKIYNLGAIEPGAIEPGAIEPGAIEPGAIEPGAIEPGDLRFVDLIKGNTGSIAPLNVAAANDKDGITVTWDHPQYGQVTQYNIWRSDPDHPLVAGRP